MLSQNTPKLKLLMKDPTLDGHEYFDVKTMMNDNWEKIDEFAGELNEEIITFKERLDVNNTKTVTLAAGVQILNSVKTAPFSLTGLTGRTMVNLLGRAGGVETLNGLNAYQTNLALDTVNKVHGKSGVKITLGSGYSTGAGFFSSILLKAGKYYVLIVEAKNGNATNAKISVPQLGTGSLVTDTTTFKPSFLKVAPASDISVNVDLFVTGTAGQYAYFDAARVYEVSAAEYASLSSMNADQVSAKYPYVDSITPVRNPYAIRYGENLLPPFYEWNLHANAIAQEPYKLQLKATAGEQGSSVIFPCAPNTNYKISGTFPIGTYVRVVFYDVNGSVISDLFSTTIKTPINCYRMGIVFLNNNAEGATGTFVFDQMMFNIGSQAKPFKPREDTMLALQTDLYADPVTGANADTVFERDGQYFKNKNWQGLVLNGNQAWAYKDSKAGNKLVTLPLSGQKTDSERIVKYDGKLIAHVYPWTGADQSFLAADGLYLSIPAADSGWGDSYSPLADEIKAYFMGWKMKQFGAGDNVPYTSGTKEWVQILNPIATNTTTLPVIVAPNYTPYQLVYQLATPTVEPITSEGQLSFLEGENQVEVGTGIVLREGSRVAFDSLNYFINSNTYGSQLKNRAGMILSTYINGRKDVTPVYQNNPSNAYGEYQVKIFAADYDPSASYSVTYLMMDRSPVVPFVGAYAANEKMLLLDLVQDVQQNTTRVSVLENKKAEKDNPAWITSAGLLNGWITAGIVPEYRQVGNKVQLRMRVKGGVIGSPVIILPKEYRPSKYSIVPIHSYSGSADVLATLILDVNGSVIPSAGSNNQINVFVEFNLD